MFKELNRSVDLNTYTPDSHIVAVWEKSTSHKTPRNVFFYGVDVNRGILKTKKIPPADREINVFVLTNRDIYVVFPTGKYMPDDAWSIPGDVAEHFLGRDTIYAAFQGVVCPNGSRHKHVVCLFQLSEKTDPKVVPARIQKLGESVTNPRKLLHDNVVFNIMDSLNANRLEVVRTQYLGNWLADIRRY